MSQYSPPLTFLAASRHASLARLLQREINLRGHTAIIAENAEDAQAMAGSILLDLVLLDSCSIGDDVLETARHLLAIRSIPILMLAPSPEEVARARTGGVEISGCLLKPFTTQRLWSAIWDALAAHSGSQPDFSLRPFDQTSIPFGLQRAETPALSFAR